MILGPDVRRFISPNDLHIQYYSWSCVDNCILPEFHWRRILNEKYEVTPAPKVYSLMTPDHDGQELSVKIKSPIPLTIALLPSHLADQVYLKIGNIWISGLIGLALLVAGAEIRRPGRRHTGEEGPAAGCKGHDGPDRRVLRHTSLPWDE